jgi:hypothetical protein
VPEIAVHRVTVRGRFGTLAPEVREYLVRVQPEHDVFRAEYTREGTLTYDARIEFFTLRYEVRCGGENHVARAEASALEEAEAFLRTMRFAHRGLAATVVDASAVWGPDDRAGRVRGPGRDAG